MIGPFRVDGRNNKIGGGKGPKFWKPRIESPPSMRPRAEKLERKEERMSRRVGGIGKLAAMDTGGGAQITCWVDRGDIRQRLRGNLRGRGTMTRDKD